MSFVSGIGYGIQILQPDPTSIAGSALNTNFRILEALIASGVSNSGIRSVYEDKTPQLGGPLDVGTGSTSAQPIYNYAGGPIILGGEPGTFLALASDEVFNYHQGNYCVNLQYTSSGNPAYASQIGCFGDRCGILGGDGNRVGSLANQITSTYYDVILGGTGNIIGQDVVSSCIAGGVNNLVSGDNSMVAAGQNNYVGPNATHSFVGGNAGITKYPAQQSYGVYPLDNSRGGFQRIMWGQWGDFGGGSGIMDFYGYNPALADNLRFYRVRRNCVSYLNLQVVMSCSGDISDVNDLYHTHFFSPLYLVFVNASGTTHFAGGESWYANVTSGVWFGDVQGTFQSELKIDCSGEYVLFHTRGLGIIDHYRASCMARGTEINLYGASSYEDTF